MLLYQVLDILFCPPQYRFEDLATMHGSEEHTSAVENSQAAVGLLPSSLSCLVRACEKYSEISMIWAVCSREIEIGSP